MAPCGTAPRRSEAQQRSAQAAERCVTNERPRGLTAPLRTRARIWERAPVTPLPSFGDPAPPSVDPSSLLALLSSAHVGRRWESAGRVGTRGHNAQKVGSELSGFSMPPTQASVNEDGTTEEGDAAPTRDGEPAAAAVEAVVGCTHYRRRCKLRSPCCGELFSCRFCHDADKSHTMNRHDVKSVVCNTCGHEQPPCAECLVCGAPHRRPARCTLPRPLATLHSPLHLHCRAPGACRHQLWGLLLLGLQPLRRRRQEGPVPLRQVRHLSRRCATSLRAPTRGLHAPQRARARVRGSRRRPRHHPDAPARPLARALRPLGHRSLRRANSHDRVVAAGGRENFFHCDTCGACYSTELRNNHVCVPNSMQRDCPICCEFLFDSLEAPQASNGK